MEIEKSLTLDAPIDHVWKVLLDPAVMAGCVPGTQSVEVLSETDYVAEVKVKISFISARFKVKTHVLETRPPSYLRCEGTGDDASVASSVRYVAELFLTDRNGTTDLTVKASADVFGRLGSFGLAVMKTKVDRMWEEFGTNLSAVLRAGQLDNVSPSAGLSQERALPGGDARGSRPESGDVSPHPRPAADRAASAPGRPAAHWWQRLLPARATASSTMPSRRPNDIFVEVQRGDQVIRVVCPAEASGEIVGWLKQLSR